MSRLRHHILAHRHWAAWLIALALLMKLVMPAGFMPMASAGSITIQLCTGTGPQTIVMAVPGVGDHQDKQGEQGKTDSPCLFSGLGAPSLAAADPILLAVAIAFIMATSLRFAPIAAAAGFAHVRPPLRGPPVTF